MPKFSLGNNSFQFRIYKFRGIYFGNFKKNVHCINFIDQYRVEPPPALITAWQR